MVRRLDPRTIRSENMLASILERIASYMFHRRARTHGHVIPLLMYCIEMNRICEEAHAWYRTDMLTDILADILLGIDYFPPKSALLFTRQNCNFIFFAMLRFIINILYYL